MDDKNELFIIVDENDNILEYRTRYECHHDNALLHRAVSLVIFDKKGRLLMQKRSRVKDIAASLWSVSVSGHVSRGETYKQTVCRELKEELGISLPVVFIKKIIISSDVETEIVSIYKAKSDGPFYPNKIEIEDLEFVSKDKLQKKITACDIAMSCWSKKILKEIGFLLL